MEHWERVYTTKGADQVSWYARHLDASLGLIERATISRRSKVIDVGAGTSTLVDDLLGRGFEDLTVLDISHKAVDVCRDRLGKEAERVHWITADVTKIELESCQFDVWHDRAVFHFLTAPADRIAYVRQVKRSVRVGGHVIVATFGPEGPKRCSGLDVVRYDSDSLHHEFGPRFRLLESSQIVHRTPSGTAQQFLYCYCVLE
jgi:ubiquinone/menaquinone biosynthesis C-methylase UbiE